MCNLARVHRSDATRLADSHKIIQMGHLEACQTWPTARGTACIFLGTDRMLLISFSAQDGAMAGRIVTDLPDAMNKVLAARHATAGRAA